MEIAGPIATRRRTRVSRYNPEYGLRLCERIATTPKSLAKLCRAPDMPSVATRYEPRTSVTN